MASTKHFAARLKRLEAKPMDPRLPTYEKKSNMTSRLPSKIIPITLSKDRYFEERLNQRRLQYLENSRETVANLQRKNSSLEEQRRFLHGQKVALEKQLKAKRQINRGKYDSSR